MNKTMKAGRIALTLLLALLLAAAILLPFRTVRAAAGYTFTEYAVDFDYVSGRTFRVEERISVHYSVGGGHGIYRSLPLNSGERYADVRGDVADTEYES